MGEPLEYAPNAEQGIIKMAEVRSSAKNALKIRSALPLVPRPTPSVDPAARIAPLVIVLVQSPTHRACASEASTRLEGAFLVLKVLSASL